MVYVTSVRRPIVVGMCRGKASGGRRCPGCQGAEAAAKHNARRRQNRAAHAAIIAWAGEHEAFDQVAQLEAGGPAAAKAWARQQNLGSAVLGLPTGALGAEERARFGPGHKNPKPPAAPEPVDVPTLPSEKTPNLTPEEVGVEALLMQVLAKMQQQAQRNPSGDIPQAPPAGPESWMTPQLMGQIGVVFAQQGEHPAERALLNAEVIDRAPLAAGGINETMRVALGNGTYGYHKSFDGLDDRTAKAFGQHTRQQPMHEVAAWRLSSQLGEPWQTLVPPVVLRNVDGVLGSLMEERPGFSGAVFPGLGLAGGRPVSSEQTDAGAFFDCLVGQQDRHAGNYLITFDDQRKMTLIDHGFCFATPQDIQSQSFLVGHRWAQGRHQLIPKELDALQRLLDSPSALGLQGLIEPDRLNALRDRARLMLDLKTLLAL